MKRGIIAGDLVVFHQHGSATVFKVIKSEGVEILVQDADGKYKPYWMDRSLATLAPPQKQAA